MRRSFFAIFLSVLLFSCVPEDHVLEVEIINSTSEPIQNLRLLTGEDNVSFNADNLPAGQEINHTLQVPGNFADGKYTFRFTRSNGEEESTTGSYMEEEEGALKKILVFEIEEQGVNVDHKVLEVE